MEKRDMKRVSRIQLKKALQRAYGFAKNSIDIRRNPRRPSEFVVTARFSDGAGQLVLRGRSLLAAARTNPRLAAEFS
jgi:hypothetical protein